MFDVSKYCLEVRVFPFFLRKGRPTETREFAPGNCMPRGDVRDAGKRAIPSNNVPMPVISYIQPLNSQDLVINSLS